MSEDSNDVAVERVWGFILGFLCGGAVVTAILALAYLIDGCG